MGIRELLNLKPWVSAVVVATGVVMLGVMIWQSGDRGIPLDKIAFYTADDGVTWFKEDAGRLPPFTHDGKQAYRAFVYRCDGKMFVAYMQRYSESAKKAWEEKLKNVPPERELQARAGLARGGEFKRPGETNWFNPAAAMMTAGAVMNPKCKDGSDAIYVEP